MKEHKYTDEKVIKALERCVEGTSEACHVCAFGINPPYPVCKTMVEKLALDLINRQKAEIERLHSEVKEKTETIVFLKDQATGWSIDFCNLKKKLNTAKAEAIKEFAEKLKKELTTGAAVMRVSTLDIINDFVKELTEGKT